MTPEDLESLILESTSTTALLEAFAPLDLAQRKKLSSFAQKLHSQLSRNRPNKDASDRLKLFLKKRKGDSWRYWNSEPSRNATLALFALGPVSSLKKGDIYVGWKDAESLAQIVLDRRPDWLDEWIEYDLSRDFPFTSFTMLRQWTKAGICKKPETDAYYAMFAAHMMAPASHNEPPRPPLSKQLLEEPELLDDVWEIFRVESLAFNTDEWLKRNAPDDYESWPDALVKLSESGQLDRQRLLDASLEGLSQDLKQNQLSGFHKFHKRLAPDAAERERRQAEYLPLLAHSVGHVCKFALDMLGQVEKDGQLDTGTFLGEVQAVFLQEGKGNAIAALKLIQRILKNQPDRSEEGLRAVAEALRHSNADVQERAIDILDTQKVAIKDELMDEIAELSGFVSASMKIKLSALVGRRDRGDHAADQVDSRSHADVERAIASLSSPENKALRIGEILEGETFRHLPISNDVMDHAILPTVAPLDPVDSVDGLIALTSHAVEIVESPDVIEQIVDGVSRLCHEKSDDFRGKSAPLLHRLEKGGSESSKGIMGYGGVQLAVADLLVSWLKSKLYRTPTNEYSKEDACFEPTVAHLRTIALRVVDGKPAPLLSTPSHTGGWIDPVVWVKRLHDAEAMGHRYERLDFCLSVLRLTPDNRAAALPEAKRLSGAYKRVAVFALGGNAQLTLKDLRAYDLWIAAARSRDPYADWTEFLGPLKVVDPWPDSSRPARYRWRAYIEESKTHKHAPVYKIPRLEVNVGTDERPVATDPKDGLLGKVGEVISSQFKTDWKKLPSAALHQHKEEKHYWSFEFNTTWVTQWLPYQWPLNPGGAYMTGVRALMGRIDDDSSNWAPGFGHLNALFQRNRPWREPGHLLLCLGLAGKDADSRGLAIDAIIEGIESGQFDPQIFAEILLDLSEGGWLKLNRLGDNLMQVTQTSQLHAWVVSECIQLWLLDTDIKQRNLHRILEVLLEARAETGQALKDDVRDRLGSIKGSSKVAKLATKLRKLCDDRSHNPETMKRLAVSARLLRT